MRGLTGLDSCAYDACGSGSNIGAEGGSAIGAALAMNSTLTVLSLLGRWSVLWGMRVVVRVGVVGGGVGCTRDSGCKSG